MRLRRLLLIAIAASALVTAAAPSVAAACPLGSRPVWADYAGFGVHGYPVASVLARPNVTLAVGTQDRALDYESAGASTVGWHMKLPALVGTPSNPFRRTRVLSRVSSLLALADDVSTCDPPWLALNELQGAQRREPLSRSELRYRANILALAKGLRAGGIRPFVLLPRIPHAKTRYRSYWRSLSQHANLVFEAYSFSSRRAISLGTVGGKNYLRDTWRDSMRRLRPFVVSMTRAGIMIPYWSKNPRSGRIGLSDARWFRLTRMKVRATQSVAATFGLGTVWSWGWSTNPATGERDPDKPKTACVYLNQRNPALCDPAAM
jgi:hypothetical protein